MECPRLALYFASLLFSANLFAQSGLVAKPPPTKLDTPEAIAEFNVIYDVLQTNTRQQFPAITAQVAEFMKKYPDTSAAYAILGELKYRQFSLANSCGSMSDEVVMLASKAIAVNSLSAEAYTLGAKAAICNQNHAVYYYADRAIQLAPTKPEALYVKARILEQQNKFAESEQFFRKTIELLKEPKRKSNIYFWMAKMLTSDERSRSDRQADLNKAEDAYRKMVDLDSENSLKACQLDGFLVQFRSNVESVARRMNERADATCGGFKTYLAKYAIWAKKYLAGQETANSLAKIVEMTGVLPDDAFVVAARFPGRGDVVRSLLQAKGISNIDTIGSGQDRGLNGCCPAIVHASYQGDTELVSLLLKNGANVNAEGDNKRTPLVYALFGEDVKMTEMLLKNGARPNATFDNGYVPLYRAILSTQSAATLVELLLKNKANPNAVTNGVPMMTWAITSNKIEILRLLLAYGADPNLKGGTSPTGVWTPFRDAVDNANVDAVALLLAAGASDSIDGRDGLEWARAKGNQPGPPEMKAKMQDIARLIAANRAKTVKGAAK